MQWKREFTFYEMEEGVNKGLRLTSFVTPHGQYDLFHATEGKYRGHWFLQSPDCGYFAVGDDILARLHSMARICIQGRDLSDEDYDFLYTFERTVDMDAPLRVQFTSISKTQ